MSTRYSSAFVMAGLLALGLAAPAEREVVAQAGSQPEVSQAISHGRSKPLRDIPRRLPKGPRRSSEPREIPGAPVRQQTDTATQQLAMVASTVSTGIGFDGIGEGWAEAAYNVVYAPSDINGAVGTTQYVQWVNASFAVFDKAGGLLAGPTLGSALWDGTNTNCDNNNDGDPIAQFDKAARRWMMTQFQVSVLPYSQCVAVSTTADATGTWNLYEFTYSQFPDYPKVGVWPDAYYVSFNMFSGNSFAGPRACAYERDRMLAGLSARQVCFQPTGYGGSLLPSDLDGLTPPPAGSPNVFLNFGTNILRRWKFHVDWSNTANSTFIGPTSIPVAAFTRSCNGASGSCVPQVGTSQQLDTLGDRLMYRLAYRNFGTHESLVVNHSVTGAYGGTSPRWYEIRNPNGTPVVYQQSTYAPDALHRWMGSAAMDRYGNLAIGYSVSSSAMNPSIMFAGRAAGDTLSTLSLETNLRTGTGSQTTSLSRWGDYTALSVDPLDDCTFWYTNQYLKTNGTWNWSTWIASFSFPECVPVPPTPDFSVSASPTSQTITAGQSASYGVTVSPINGYAAPGSYAVSGLPAGATGSFAPAGFGGANGYGSTLTVATMGSLAAGTYPFTIVANDGTLTRSTPATLVVNAPVTPSFTMSVSPSSRKIRTGQSTTFNVTLTRTGGFTSAVAFSVSGVPSKAVGTFSPSSTAGNTSTLTVTTNGSPKGTYSLVITSQGGSPTVTRQSTVSLQLR